MDKKSNDSLKNSEHEYLTDRQVERRYGISHFTLRNWRHQRKGPDYVKLGHKKILYSRSAFDEFMRQHTIEL